MSKIKLPPESEVVSWLQQLIEKEELLESIQGQEAINEVLSAENRVLKAKQNELQVRYLPSGRGSYESLTLDVGCANLWVGNFTDSGNS